MMMQFILIIVLSFIVMKKYKFDIKQVPIIFQVRIMYGHHVPS